MKHYSRTQFPNSPMSPVVWAVLYTISLFCTAQANGQSLAPQALPSGGQVLQGQVNIQQSANVLTIQQSSSNAIIQWGSFNIGRNSVVQFLQPDSTSSTLNRVVNGSTEIAGRLHANGNVFLLNPNGILFTPTAQVNVGSLVAASGTVRDADYLTGDTTLLLTPNGHIQNQGHITSAQGGQIVLVARNVSNSGTLQAPGGLISVLGGDSIRVNVTADGLIQAQLNEPLAGSQVNNTGIIDVSDIVDSGGVVRLVAHSVTHSGVVDASSAQGQAGRVELRGDMSTGEVKLSGRIEASSSGGGHGGFVETSAAKVKISDSAQVSTMAEPGKSGTWLIDPTDFTIYAGVGNLGSSGIGSQTLSSNIENGNVIIETAAFGSQEGNIFVDAPVSWNAHQLTLRAHNNIFINADMIGSGTASLALERGQSTVDGVNSDVYIEGAKISLPSGFSLSSKEGSAGASIPILVINDLAGLDGIRNDLAGHYAIGSDIDASATRTWAGGTGFLPIGKEAGQAFTGSLVGLGHTIDGLYMNHTSDPSDTGGLFYNLSGLVAHLGITNADITAYSAAAPLAAGVSGTGKVYRSYATGQANATFWTAAGLVGGLSDFGMIIESYADVQVNGSRDSGGLVGGISGGTILNSYALGNVNDASVNGSLIGVINGSANIINSYATGRGNNLIALICCTPYTGTVSNSYWNADTAKNAYGENLGTGKTTTQLQTQSTFAGWDFDAAWYMPANGGLPQLQWQRSTPAAPPPSAPPVVAEVSPSQTVVETVQSEASKTSASTEPALMLASNLQEASSPVYVQSGETSSWRQTLFAAAEQKLNQSPDIGRLGECGSQVGVKGECIAKPRVPVRTTFEDGDDGTTATAISVRRALIIGNSQYGAPLASLAGVKKDTREVGALLSRLGFDVTIANNATREEMVAALNKLILESGPHDSVVVYYAGHGHLHRGSSNGYWLPSDASVSDPSSWLANTDITRFVANIPAKQVLLISDSCYSGVLTREAEARSSTPLDRNAILKRRSVVVMSSGGEEPVADIAEHGQSPFTEALLKKLGELDRQELRAQPILQKIGEDLHGKYQQTPFYGTLLSAGHIPGGEYLFSKGGAD
jgi:filamentous hemagglutinin family protein